MQYWSDKLKLGKSSAFVKRDLRMIWLTRSSVPSASNDLPHEYEGQLAKCVGDDDGKTGPTDRKGPKSGV
jgi:hypothetical protein